MNERSCENCDNNIEGTCFGSFPLIWEQINGRGSCLWASEIEEFPIAVTKRHFDDVGTNE